MRVEKRGEQKSIRERCVVVDNVNLLLRLSHLYIESHACKMEVFDSVKTVLVIVCSGS